MDQQLTKAAVERVANLEVPDELVRRVHDANARFRDLGQRLAAFEDGDREQGHQNQLDVLSAALREAEKAVQDADGAVRDRLNRPV